MHQRNAQGFGGGNLLRNHSCHPFGFLALANLKRGLKPCSQRLLVIGPGQIECQQLLKYRGFRHVGEPVAAGDGGVGGAGSFIQVAMGVDAAGRVFK